MDGIHGRRASLVSIEEGRVCQAEIITFVGSHLDVYAFRGCASLGTKKLKATRAVVVKKVESGAIRHFAVHNVVGALLVQVCVRPANGRNRINSYSSSE